MSMPKQWKTKDGTITELDTPYNIRAKELKDIYNSFVEFAEQKKIEFRFLTELDSERKYDPLQQLRHGTRSAYLHKWHRLYPSTALNTHPSNYPSGWYHSA